MPAEKPNFTERTRQFSRTEYKRGSSLPNTRTVTKRQPTARRSRSSDKVDERHHSSRSKRRSSLVSLRDRHSQSLNNYSDARLSLPRRSSVRKRASNGTTRTTSPQRHCTSKSTVCVILVVLLGCGLGVGILVGIYTQRFTENDGSDSDTQSETLDTYNSKNNLNGLAFNSEVGTETGRVGVNGNDCGLLDPDVEKHYIRQKRNAQKRINSTFTIRPRIIGGTKGLIEHFPWQVSLWAGSSHLCGGTIIASNWILFAAHCIPENAHADVWTVYAGESDQRRMKTRSQIAKPVAMIQHRGFDPNTYENDIALLRLQRHLMLGRNVKTACLPNQFQTVQDNDVCRISGWGGAYQGDGNAVFLHSAPVRIISRYICNGQGWLTGLVSQNMFCAGTEDGSIDSCQGDSGGPLTCYNKDEKKSYVMGVNSWGIGCGRSYHPGVYTNLPRYYTWIQNEIRKEEARYSGS